MDEREANLKEVGEMARLTRCFATCGEEEAGLAAGFI